MLNLSSKQYVNFFKLENELENKIDVLEFDNKNYFSKVVTLRKELADKLINDNEVVNAGIIFIGEYIRSTVEIAVNLIINLNELTEKRFITKELSKVDFNKFSKLLDKELSVAAIHNENRMWTTFGTAYGQGMERGLTDLGISSEGIEWEKYRETSAYKETAFQTLRQINSDLSNRIKIVVASGVAEGNSNYDIARRLREIKLNPKLVEVAPKIVNDKVVRRGYSYVIPERRYANMIARTESSRAINQGRLDAYNRAGIEQVEWLTAGDERVCGECESLDGQKFPVNNTPLLPAHVFCRCTIVVSGKITDEDKREMKDKLKLSPEENNI
jgi:SPP1 gp7 family putative phage head morphogenesis protein